DLPFETLVEALRPPRDLSRTPVFQVMFVLQNNRLPDLERQDMRLSALLDDEGTGTAKFDLTLALEDDERGGMVGSMEYDADLFDEATITQMLDRFRVLLRAAVSDPQLRVSELPLLTEDERLKLVDRWNPSSIERPRQLAAHHLFEAQAARTPGAVALQAG